MGAYFVAGDLRLVVEGLDLLPVQYNLGIRCVPHHFNRRLTGRWEQKDTFFTKRTAGTGAGEATQAGTYAASWW